MRALRFSAGSWRCVFAWMLLLVGLAAQGTELSELERLRIAQVFPAVERIGDPEGDYGVRRLSKGEETLGYAFQTLSVTDIPAYSGKPINLQVILDPQAVTVDAVSGATVTVMVVNEIVMRAAHTVAVSLGLIEDRGNVRPKPAQVRQQPAATASWSELLGNGAIRRLQLSRGQIDDAFKGSEAEGIGEADAAHRDEPFIDLYSALLNPPAVGRSLLGDNQYRELMASLKPSEYAFVVLGDGEYSFKGSGYVRGGIFDRVQLRQFGDIISFRDLDYQRLSDVYAEGMPEFREMAIFVARASQRFDPGSPWTLELLVRRQTGPVAGVFTSFELACQTPEEYLERPQPTAEELAALEEAARPLWLRVWYQKSFQIGVLCTALVLLLAILFLQDRLVRRPRLMQRLRTGYLAFTLVYLGWYSLGQLSVVNVLTFVHALFEGFRWELFLSDPLLFILWTFTAASLLLWGRGVFCGWLCPFGALQELLNELARKLRVPQFQVPFAVHERLWAIKYIILLVLFGLSLESLALAEQAAEVEPFKTAITLGFDRQWWFVAYAVALLVVNLFTRKVYCRYLCPLGAALAIPAKARLFDWLKRRAECGKPCQLCARECEIQAIHPDGRIEANECHYCLDCQMTYHDQDKCPPLVNKRKKRAKSAPADNARIPAENL
ncbi:MULTISPECIES: transcriptional regulator NosR [unclassified Pseudomonas]|uniref:transcriptional regulator NosR n=1 Tax=unclassified Pseudomonas TaxID=196821 RepID=UPI002157E4BF|nr:MULTISPECIES: NosR/NirI family protein [unclassified Pseudomonas]